jgi:hypothetical protein
VEKEKDTENNLYTFTTATKGGLGCIGKLCKDYGKGMRQHPNQLPVIELDVGSYLHSKRSLGRIKYPIFKHVRWVARGPFDELLNGGDDQAAIADQSSEEPVF